MKIGVFLTIEAYNPETNSIEKYRSKVIDSNDKYFYTDYPVHIQTKRTTSFLIGANIAAEYLGDDQSVYRFHTIIKDKHKGKIPTLVFELPEEDQIERIQRRQYVRVETAMDVAIHSAENEFNPFTTVTVDVSGGGVSIVAPRGVHMEEGAKIVVYLVLPLHSGEYHYLDLPAEVVRLIENESTANTASIKFLNLKEQDKQIIIRYCFEKQREARQKEVQ